MKAGTFFRSLLPLVICVLCVIMVLQWWAAALPAERYLDWYRAVLTNSQADFRARYRPQPCILADMQDVDRRRWALLIEKAAVLARQGIADQAALADFESMSAVSRMRAAVSGLPRAKVDQVRHYIQRRSDDLVDLNNAIQSC